MHGCGSKMRAFQRSAMTKRIDQVELLDKWAAAGENLSIVQLLLTYEPEVDAKDESGWTPLMIAGESPELCPSFSRPKVHEANLDSLFDAVSAGQPDVVHTLVEAGAKVDEENAKGQTPLFYAASKNHLSIGRYLINKGADINHKDRASQVPLHRAATTGSVSLLQLLLNPPEGRPKTRLNGMDRAGNTALHLAMESGHGEAAITLIEAGADRERTNSDGQTPEEIEGVGEREQKKVRDYVVSRVGPRIE
ncbi:hypothetical protein FFLO_02056 [Filobasidium floriforme]|uniref:26S proteasome non-ATPase regulatory subunit 10 n=1 Tax=Filobasidium floriforme TaxID=5210 RepID=A0A8K0JP03_9TREE|nr:hypothetical protein FFLO_02056 [Filobasidium floriforme]